MRSILLLRKLQVLEHAMHVKGVITLPPHLDRRSSTSRAACEGLGKAAGKRGLEESFHQYMCSKACRETLAEEPYQSFSQTFMQIANAIIVYFTTDHQAESVSDVFCLTGEPERPTRPPHAHLGPKGATPTVA